MSGLKDNVVNVTFLNIRQGRIVVKEQGAIKEYGAVEGEIRKVQFVEEEYEGKKVEKARIYMNAVGQSFVLSIKVDSGYFRGFVNSLRSSTNPKSMVEIQPHMSKDGKKQTTCFVSQNGITLKHFFTKNNIGDLPQLEKFEFKGETKYDNTKQIEYWKKWINETFNEPTDGSSSIVEPISEVSKSLDDLPF